MYLSTIISLTTHVRYNSLLTLPRDGQIFKIPLLLDSFHWMRATQNSIIPQIPLSHSYRLSLQWMSTVV